MLKKQITLIVILLGLIGLGLSYIFLNGVENYTFENEAKYFVNGIEYNIPIKTKASINDDGTLTIKIDDFEFDTDTLPVYVNDYYEIILTSDMACYIPDYNGKFEVTLLPQLSDISYDYSILSAVLKRNDNTNYEQYGFLYDGHNTYIFLENFDITFNNKTVSLSPLSYAIVEDDTWIQLYDEASCTYYYEEISDDAIALSKSNNYTINLGKDVVTYYNSSTILNSGFVMLDHYFSEASE